MTPHLLILERDGILNPHPPAAAAITHPDQWQAIPGALDALAQLTRADYRIIIITNQPGIAAGLLSINTLNQIHQKMLDQLHPIGGEISAIFFCPHAPTANCPCHKPKPGLYQELANRLQCPLTQVPALDTSPTNLQAATTAGASPILLSDTTDTTIPTYRNLAEFTTALLADQSSSARKDTR